MCLLPFNNPHLRLDCHPEANPNPIKCERKGCCWDRCRDELGGCDEGPKCFYGKPGIAGILNINSVISDLFDQQFY